MSAYRGTPNGPRDPATPGGYCLARCLCGTCPQYREQRRQLALRIEGEQLKRLADEGKRHAAAQHTRKAAA